VSLVPVRKSVAKPRRTADAHTSATVVALDATLGAKIVEMVASGVTVTKAAETLKISRKHASELFNRELADILAETNEQRQLLLARELETLRLLKRAWMAKALRGDYQAARVILQVGDRVANLLDLNAAIHVEISNKRIDETVASVLELLDSAGDIPMILDSEDVG
jgi:hypothetical protein